MAFGDQNAPLCVAGLGNPGGEYLLTRHNIGFRVLESLGEDWSAPVTKNFSKARGEYGQGEFDGRKVYLLKPLKYMNLSGEVVAPFLQFFKIPLSNLVVLHDEIDLPFGDNRWKAGGGHRGHNGLRDIIKQTGSADFARLRCGVDRPPHKDVAGYVLSPFSAAEEEKMPANLEEIKRILLDHLR